MIISSSGVYVQNHPMESLLAAAERVFLKKLLVSFILLFIVLVISCSLDIIFIKNLKSNFCPYCGSFMISSFLVNSS